MLVQRCRRWPSIKAALVFVSCLLRWHVLKTRRPLIQDCFIVVSALKMEAQFCVEILCLLHVVSRSIPNCLVIFVVRWSGAMATFCCAILDWKSGVLLLDLRQRRWPNIGSALCCVFWHFSE